MTLSGVTDFDPPFTDAIEEAWERAVGTDSGAPRSGYDMRSSRRSINLLFADWANRGVNMWTMEQRSVALTQLEDEYTLGTDNDIVDVIENTIRLVGSQPIVRYAITRVSISTQATRTNPDIQGRPTEVWFDRTIGNPVAHIWPLPPADGLYVLDYVVLRRMDDAGAYTNTADMPFRFLPAFIAGLAFYIAQKKQPDNIQLLTRLENDYEKVWQRAADEDREKATLSLVPRGDTYRVM